MRKQLEQVQKLIDTNTAGAFEAFERSKHAGAFTPAGFKIAFDLLTDMIAHNEAGAGDITPAVFVSMFSEYTERELIEKLDLDKEVRARVEKGDFKEVARAMVISEHLHGAGVEFVAFGQGRYIVVGLE